MTGQKFRAAAVAWAVDNGFLYHIIQVLEEMSNVEFTRSVEQRKDLKMPIFDDPDKRYRRLNEMLQKVETAILRDDKLEALRILQEMKKEVMYGIHGH